MPIRQLVEELKATLEENISSAPAMREISKTIDRLCEGVEQLEAGVPEHNVLCNKCGTAIGEDGGSIQVIIRRLNMNGEPLDERVGFTQLMCAQHLGQYVRSSTELLSEHKEMILTTDGGPFLIKAVSDA